MPSKKIEIFPRKSQLPELPRLRTSHSSGLPWLPRIRTPSSPQLEHRIADRQVREVLCLYACWKPGPGPGRFACDESFKPTRTRNTRTRLTRLAEGARPAAEQDFHGLPTLPTSPQPRLQAHAAAQFKGPLALALPSKSSRVEQQSVQ